MFKHNIVLEDPIHVDTSSIAPVDQFPTQDFNLGENGFPMSDIQLILKTDSEELRKVLLSRLEVQKQMESNPDMSDEELIRNVVPRYIQTPAEIKEFTRVFHQMYPAEQPKTFDGTEPEPMDTQSVDASKATE